MTTPDRCPPPAFRNAPSCGYISTRGYFWHSGAIVAFGLLVLYSASHRDLGTLANQALRIGAAFLVMFVAAQLNPRIYLRWAPALYVLGIVLLIAVLFFGTTAMGARRWLDLPGLPRFQPAELMKVAVPLAVALVFPCAAVATRGFGTLLVALGLCMVPTALIVPQPDLGTGVMVACRRCCRHRHVGHSLAHRRCADLGSRTCIAGNVVRHDRLPERAGC